MIRPERERLQQRVEVNKTLVGGPRLGKSERGPAGKTVVTAAVEARPAPNQGKGGRKRPLGRLRLQAVPDASAASPEGFITAATEQPLTVNTDGWAGYRAVSTPRATATSRSTSADPLRGLLAAPASQIGSMASWPSMGDAPLRLLAIHLVFSLAKRWLFGTHHGAARPKHLQHYRGEFVFRFNRCRGKAISYGFARLIQHAVKTPTTTYRGILHRAS